MQLLNHTMSRCLSPSSCWRQLPAAAAAWDLSRRSSRAVVSLPPQQQLLQARQRSDVSVAAADPATYQNGYGPPAPGRWLLTSSLLPPMYASACMHGCVVLPLAAVLACRVQGAAGCCVCSPAVMPGAARRAGGTEGRHMHSCAIEAIACVVLFDTELTA
jgi:hypothetical protein